MTTSKPEEQEAHAETTNERLDAESTTADVDAAFQSAARAFESYSRWTPLQRANLLRAIASEVDALGAALTEQARAETGLPDARLNGERARTVGQLQLFADTIEEGSWVEARIDRADPSRTPPKPDLRRMLIPIGPVAIFGASNFPLAFGVAGGDTASALAAGCPVVCKGHPAHTRTSALVAGAIARAAAQVGAPAGVFTSLHGWSHEIGLAMVQHPLACAVGFTGSLRAGRALLDAAAARSVPIPVYAEMGSINPVFIFPSALEQRRAEVATALAQSVTLGVGQFCTNPGVVVAVESDALDDFIAMLAATLDAQQPGTMLYPQLCDSYNRGIERALAAGATLRTERDATSARPALLVTDATLFLAHEELRAELFGPASLIVKAKNVAEFEAVAAGLEGQLTATVHGNPHDIANHEQLIELLTRRAGRIIFNGFPTGVEVTHAMQHGGPYPASSDARTTSVGSAAIARFARPVCYQNFPAEALPPALRDENPLGIWRMIDGEASRH